MALPTILVNSASGSDTQASGAGPSTALFGTTDASFSGATVTLTAATDLTNVATDGSHVLYLLTSTGVRFFKITAKAGSGGATPTVDVTPNPAGTSTGRTWAIGGKRASIWSASSALLFDNGGSGDAMPGWTVQMESGHAESIANVVNIWRAGDTTDGPITLRGESGAGTLPVITFTNNDNGFIVRDMRWRFIGFEVVNTNGTKTSSTAFACVAGRQWFEGLKISHATNKVWKALDLRGNKNVVKSCEIGHCASHGITFENGTVGESTIVGNYIHDCGGTGIKANGGDMLGNLFAWNVIAGCGEDGIYWVDTTGGDNRGGWIVGNTIHGCTSDGIEVASTTAVLSISAILNNVLTGNGGYGLKFSGASMTAAVLDGMNVLVDRNNTNGNTSGAYLPSGYGTNDPAVDPDYVNAASGDFTPQESTLKGAAFPTSIP